jgi:hypothetical protein
MWFGRVVKTTLNDLGTKSASFLMRWGLKLAVRGGLGRKTQDRGNSGAPSANLAGDGGCHC